MLNKFGYINNISYLYGMKEHPLYKGYFVTEDGKVFSSRKSGLKELKQFMANDYMKVTPYINKKGVQTAVHKLVAEVYVPNPDNKPEVDHMDTNKLNNHFSNLEWVTRKENAERAAAAGLYKVGENNANAKLTDKDVQKIFYLKSLGWTNTAIGKEVGVNKGRIGHILKGAWRFQ